MDIADQLRDKVEDPSTSMSLSLQSIDNLQGIYVYQLPFPGTLPEKAQREQLAAIVRKYSKIIEIRFDAVPNNPDASSVQAGRRFQLPPLSRRALVVFQKIAPASFEGLLAELNKQVMSQCHLNASTAKAEHISALIAMRNAASAGPTATKTHQIMGSKNALQNPAATTTTEQSQQQQYSSKRPLTLLKIQPPAPAVKAFAMDSQTHTQPDPFHKNASRTLYVKHLDNTITEEELKVRYGKFGHILDIEVKNRNTMAPYAFIQFTNIESVANAIKAFNQQFEDCSGARQKKNSNLHWWGNTIVTSRLWIGRLPTNCGEQYLMSKMRVVLTQPDDVTQVIYDANFNEAIVMFVGHESTQIAFNKVKNRNITFQPERSSITEPVHHVHVDFCSEKLHDYFIDRLYGKNTEPLISDAILAPPPDPPKCLSSTQPKKSPSPPPDPSIETVGHCASVSKRSASRQKILLVEQQQTQNATHGFENAPLNYSSTKMGRTVRETAHPNSLAEEEPQQSHRERAMAGRSQDNSERGRFAVVRHARTNSSSSNTSTDTYSQSPRKRWRHPSQPSESNEFSNRTKTTTKKAPQETKHTWNRKHRSQRSTERRRETRVERKEKRRERRQSKARRTTGSVRRTDGDRSGEIVSGERSKKGDDGGTAASVAGKHSRTASKGEKQRKDRAKEKDHTKTSSASGCQLLPPPPAPPLRIDKDKTHDQQHKRRHSTTSSSDSHSSCTCSSCTSNSSSSSQMSSLSENSDSDLSSSGHEMEEERPSTRRSHRSRKDGLTTNCESAQINPNQSLVKVGEALNAQTVPIKCEPLPLTAPVDSKKLLVTANTVLKNAGDESGKTSAHNENKEESSNTNSKDKSGEQSHRKEQTTSTKEEQVASKKSSTVSSLPTKPPQSVGGKIQMLRPSQRTLVTIPLDAQSTPPPSDPRLTRQKPQQSCDVAETAFCLELPRFIHRTKAVTSNGDRSSVQGEETNLADELPKNTPMKVVPPTAINDGIKQEPEANDQNIKVKSEQPNNNVVKSEKNPTEANTLNLMVSITDRIKCVENGIAEFRSSVQPDQALSTNFDEIELEVARIKTELSSGISLEQLEQLIAERSVITSQIDTTNDAGVGKQLQMKVIADEETEKNRRSGEAEGAVLHERSCSFVSESDLPIRSFSLSCDHHPTTSSAAKSMRLLHEKEQFVPVASSCASPLSKQSVDMSNAFPRKSKHTDSSPNQPQSRNIAGIPKLKEIKLNRKPSNISLATSGDQWSNTLATSSLSSVKKEVKSERREHRSDSVGHLPSKEQRKEMGTTKATTVHPIIKKLPSSTLKPQQKLHPKEERKMDSSIAVSSGVNTTSVCHADQHKRQVKANLVDNESSSDVDRHQKKHKRKKKHAEQSTSSSSEESLDGSELFNEIDIEEQKRMMEAIKSGVGFGMSMYDRVKRRSSQRPDDEQKKKTALEVLKTKQAKKRKEFARVRLSSTSTDSEASEDVRTSAAHTITETSFTKPILDDDDHHPSSAEEHDEPKMETNDDLMMAEKQPTKQQTVIEINNKCSSEIKVPSNTNLTIRRPEIAPRKPFIDEPKIREEGDANSSASSVEQRSDDGSESEDEKNGEMDAGDKAIQKLKNELSRYRKSSESSFEEAKHFNEKLDRVLHIASEGCPTQSLVPPSENSVSSSSSSNSSPSSSSESDSENEAIAERSKDNSGMSKKLQPQKKVKHLSMVDVFGANSSEESFDECAVPLPHPAKVEPSTSTSDQQITAVYASKETLKKEIFVPKIKVDSKESDISIEREKTQGKSVFVGIEHTKRARVSSVSSVSSIEQKRFKEAKCKKSAEKETLSSQAITTTTAVRDRSKSDATALKKAQQQKQMAAMSSTSAANHMGAVLSTEKLTEMDTKTKQSQPMQTKTSIAAKVTVKTMKNHPLMKELAKRKIVRVKNNEEKRLDKTTLKRAIDSDGKDQPAKKTKTELTTIKEQSDQNKERKEKADKGLEKEKVQPFSKTEKGLEKERVQPSSKTEKGLEKEKVQLASDTAQSLSVSSKSKNDETDQICAFQEKINSVDTDQREKRESDEETMNRKKETDELLHIVAAEQMAENEFEIIDSGKVQTAETDQIVESGGETKRSHKVKEKDEEEMRKKREREEEKKRDIVKKKKEKEEKRTKKEEEERKKREQQEKEGNVSEMPTDEDDEEAMEAELLRRMEERNEEEAAVASLGLQSNIDRISSQDFDHSLRQTKEKCWKILEGHSINEDKQKETMVMTTEDEQEKEERTLEGKEEDRGTEETKCEETEEVTILREQRTMVVEESTVDKNAGFRFETVERRSSNESLDSHMAGIGNGFVEVDAEHLRQQKREQDALERLAEEKRRTEETVKRMDETVDSVAINSIITQQQNQELTTLIVQQIPANFAQQQQLTMNSFHGANQQQITHHAMTSNDFHQQREGGVVGCDFFYSTTGNTALNAQTQNQKQQQHETVAPTVSTNAPLNINIQSQYIQQPQQTVSAQSLQQQQNFSLTTTTTEAQLTVRADDATTMCKTLLTTTPSYHPSLMPATVSVDRHNQQQNLRHYDYLYQQQVSQQQQQHLQQPAPQQQHQPVTQQQQHAQQPVTQQQQHVQQPVTQQQQHVQQPVTQQQQHVQQPVTQQQQRVQQPVTQQQQHLQQPVTQQQQHVQQPVTQQQQRVQQPVTQQQQHLQPPVTQQQQLLQQPTPQQHHLQPPVPQLHHPQHLQQPVSQQQAQQSQLAMHNLQQQQILDGNVSHCHGMTNVFADMVQTSLDKAHQQQQAPVPTPMIMQQRKLSDMKPQQQHHHQSPAASIEQSIQQKPQIQQQVHLDHKLEVTVQQPPLHKFQQHQKQQPTRLEQAQTQPRQHFQMQHIVQAPSIVQQPSAIVTTPVHSQPAQQVQQTKQQNVSQRQRKAQTQQVPTTQPQQQHQKQFNVPGQYDQQQEQQQRFQLQQLHSDTLSAMSTTGLMDHQSLVSLYQHLREQQMLQQAQQQMPSISAAMIAAASAANHFSPATLSKWHSIVTPPSTMAQGGALEELLCQGLLAPQKSSFVPPSGGVESAGTSAMAVSQSTAFDELFQQKLPENSSSPRAFPQHQQQIQQKLLSNVQQRNSANPNIMLQPQQQHSQQPQKQQKSVNSGGSARYKQVHPVQPQQPQQVTSIQQPSSFCQTSEKLHQQQVQREQMQQLQHVHQQHLQLHHQQQLPQQQHHIHANESLQPPPQLAEQQLHTAHNQQGQPKQIKKQSSANKYPVLWQGQLAMKNADTLVQMHKVCGNESLIQQMNNELSLVNENGIPLLRVNQKMRLEQTHLENLIRKMEREDNQLALICLPCGRDREDVVIQTQKMNISFIEYFSGKPAAGIVSSGPTQQPSALVAHIFPPSDFSRMLLSRNAPDLLRTVETLSAGYLFVILTNK